MNKERLSASVSPELVRAAERAVAEGRAESVSAWVDEAMRRQVEHDDRMRALREFIAAWEAEHGEVTREEMDAASRATRRRAIVVRGGTVREPAKRPPERATRRATAKPRPPRKSA